MRAIQITSTGGPDVLEIADVTVGEPGVGEVRIAIEAAGVNFIDTYQRSGLYPVELPFVPGLECAGLVDMVGEGVTDIEVGDCVALAQGTGGYAEFRVAPADRCVRVPDAIDSVTATAAMIQGLTAHYLATDTWALADGDRCLIHAAAGGTGRLLVQMAKRAGAEVFATVGSPEKAALADAAGADHVINYTTTDFGDAIREITGSERPIDVVYDGVGASVFETSLSLIRPRGLMATFGNASGPVPPVAPLDLMAGGSLYLTRPTMFDYVATTDELRRRADDVFDRILEGALEVRIDSTFPLDEAARAHEHLEARRSTGKLLLTP